MSLLWEKILRPLAFTMDAERAHEIGLQALANGLAAPFYCDDHDFGLGPVERFGLNFSNPLGMAAGFDKNGKAVERLASLGFGHVEVGTVTLHPQPGNPKPRMFRLPKDGALINRLGFNNEGAAAVAERLAGLKKKCVVGVNIGKNKDVPNEEAVENYLGSFALLQPVADYVAVNISSPNTPGLRELQNSESLNSLLEALTLKNAELGRKPLLIKIAPDLDDGELAAIVEVCLEHGIDGVIATNTTTGRGGLATQNVGDLGDGGLSGRPLAQRSNEVISSIYKRSNGKLPVIGVGGVFTPEDAFAKIAAGASLIQAYTGFVYGGPSFPATIVTGFRHLLDERGFAGIDAAVGSGVR